MNEHIKQTVVKLLDDCKNKTVRVFIDTDANHFDGILNKDTFYYGFDHIVLDGTKTKQSGDMAIKQSFIKISSITSFTYIVIDLKVDK